MTPSKPRPNGSGDRAVAPRDRALRQLELLLALVLVVVVDGRLAVLRAAFAAFAAPAGP